MKICKTSKDPDNIVLLRRPRPPKKTINLRSDQNPITNSFATISSEGDFYSPITARKNCLDGTGEMKHLKSDPRRKQGDFVIHPLYPRGPEFFPPGSALHASTAPTISQLLDQVLPNEIHLPCTTKEKDQFMLNSFLIPVKIRPPVKIYPGSISHQNYQKLTSWFSRHFPRQDKLNQAKLEVGLQPPPSRVPKQQVLLGKSLGSQQASSHSLSHTHTLSLTQVHVHVHACVYISCNVHVEHNSLVTVNRYT